MKYSLELYNIYYGTGAEGAKYHFTKEFKNEAEANNFAKDVAKSFFYKNEGKHGIPSFNDVSLEVQITGLDFETLYNDHFVDLMRWYAIPTEVDTISSKNLKW